MQDFILSETRKIFNKAIKKFSKKDGVDETEVSLLLYLKDGEEEREVGYKVCHHHSPVKETNIMDILGVKIDLRGYSLFVPPQIKKILEDFENELGSNNIEVCVYLSREDDDEVIYFLYKEKKLIRKFELESVLNIEV
jgi:hypothetical protein